MPHEHIMIPLKEAIGEHHIYWCRLCGTVLERLSMGIYEMVPAWSEERLKEQKGKPQYKFLPAKREKLPNLALGRGLRDIKIPESKVLQKVLDGLDQETSRGKK